MRIAIGADHAGFELKGNLTVFLQKLGYHVFDVGTYSAESLDYPDFSEAVGLAIKDGHAERGVLICCSGVGASVAATKMPGIRAGLCHDTYSSALLIHRSQRLLNFFAQFLALNRFVQDGARPQSQTSPFIHFLNIRGHNDGRYFYVFMP